MFRAFPPHLCTCVDLAGLFRASDRIGIALQGSLALSSASSSLSSKDRLSPRTQQNVGGHHICANGRCRSVRSCAFPSSTRSTSSNPLHRRSRSERDCSCSHVCRSARLRVGAGDGIGGSGLRADRLQDLPTRHFPHHPRRCRAWKSGRRRPSCCTSLAAFGLQRPGVGTKAEGRTHPGECQRQLASCLRTFKADAHSFSLLLSF